MNFVSIIGDIVAEWLINTVSLKNQNRQSVPMTVS